MSDGARLATPADAAALARLRWLSRSDDERTREGFDDFARRFAGWLDGALASSAWSAAVAEADAAPVGCMYLRVVDTVPVPGRARRRWGIVTHAFVEPAWRGGGRGRAMLELLVTQARTLELDELQVWPSRRAVSLYARAGFLSPETLRAVPQGDEPCHVLPLRGRLR